ncbi:MAG: PLP-dependent aminotransferase family protein [Ilumatobacteraceae bacterium]
MPVTVERSTIAFHGGLPDPTLQAQLQQELVDLIGRPQPGILSYGDPRGDQRLRSAIATRMTARAHRPFTPERIVVSNGSAGGLALVAAALIAPGDVVVAEELTYPGALAIFRDRGARVVPMPLDAGGLDVDALAREILGAGVVPRLVYTIADPQSPTGTALATDRRRRLVELAERHDFLVVQDDTYGELRYSATVRPLLAELGGDRVVHVGSFSKTLAPGLRLGWVAACADVAAAIARRRLDLGSPVALQRAVAALLEDGFDARLAVLGDFYRAKRDELLAALDEHCIGSGTWSVPDAGFFVWFTPAGAAVDDVVAHGSAAADGGVTFLSASYFAVDRGHPPGLRLAFGELASGDLREGARRLGRAVEAAGGRRP